MNLYLISQNTNKGYNTYDSAVVCAPSAEYAKQLDPGGKDGKVHDFNNFMYITGWCPKIEDVIVEYIGKADPRIPVGVICASFNAA